MITIGGWQSLVSTHPNLLKQLSSQVVPLNYGIWFRNIRPWTYGKSSYGWLLTTDVGLRMDSVKGAYLAQIISLCVIKRMTPFSLFWQAVSSRADLVTPLLSVWSPDFSPQPGDDVSVDGGIRWNTFVPGASGGGLNTLITLGVMASQELSVFSLELP